MNLAIRDPSATPLDLHQYGRQLLAEKKNKEAMEIFQLNHERNGDQWPVHVGLARGFAANNDPKQALEHARKALTQAWPTPSTAKLLNLNSEVRVALI